MISSTENNKGKLKILEERLRANEGNKSYGFGDAVGLSLVPDVVIPLSSKCLSLRNIGGLRAQRAI